MRKSYNSFPKIASLNYYVVIFLTLILLQSCDALTGITVENDVVKSSKRMKMVFSYVYTQERHSPLQEIKQTVLKEFNAENETTYSVYEVLLMDKDTHPLNKELYVIIDGEVNQIQLKSLESEDDTSLSEKKKDILTADSTKVSVVTNYSLNSRKKFKISYMLNNELIEKMKNSNEVKFRYYAGPDMITTKLNSLNLSRFKKLIAAS